MCIRITWPASRTSGTCSPMTWTGRAVRGFAEQYDVRVGEQIEQLINLVVAVDRACYPRHRLREFTYGNRHHDQTCRRQTWCQMSGYVATKFFQRVR